MGQMGRKKRKTRKSLGRRVTRWLLRGVFVVVVSSVLLVFVLRYVDPPITSFMLQRRAQARANGRDDFVLRQRWVDLADLPTHVGLAVISSEDQRFFEHGGFDLGAIKDAVGERLSGKPLRGASTLTQQVAKNLWLWEGRSLLRKSLESYFTLLLELCWSKPRILEVYLNVAELGDGVFGVGAAATHHFQRDATRLTRSQAALLAAVLPSPIKRNAGRPSPAVVRKQQWILEQMRVLPHYQTGLSRALADAKH